MQLTGGVHSSTPTTLLSIAKITNMDPTRTIWVDIGCGAPILSLQGSFFNLETYCIDYPSVIDEVLNLIELMPSDYKNLMKRLRIHGGDIFKMKMESFPPSFSKVTHVTILIGIPDGNLLKFSQT